MDELTLLQLTTGENLQGFPRLISHGPLLENLYFIIMAKYGNSLKTLLRKSKKKRFSLKTSVQITMQLLTHLEHLHELGYLHNDLKPDNILIESNNMKHESSSNLILIDFNVARLFKDRFGEHIEFKQKVAFSGNFMFASKNSFLQVQLSRRDDLLSLLYLFTYFVTGKTMWSGCMSI